MDKTYLAYLLFYFMLYSISGWLMESIYRSICEKKIINTGFLHGPYCPIYGFGTVIMIIFLGNIKNNPILLFASGFIILSVWEYLVGIYLEKIFHQKYWDYSKSKFNIKGRVCLLNSIYWGILSLIFMMYVQPNVETVVTQIPINVIKWIDIILYSSMLADAIVTIVNLHTLKSNMIKIKNMSNKILDKLKEPNKLKNKNSENNIDNAEIQKLQLETNKLKLKMYKQLERLKNAFSGIDKEPINKFFKNNKVDLKDLKQKIKDLQIKIKKEPEQIEEMIKDKSKNKVNKKQKIEKKNEETKKKL